MNDILQWAAVVAILIVIVIYFVRKMSRKDGNGGCSGCALNGNCKSRECRDRTDADKNKQKK